VPIAREIFDRLMQSPNQLHKQRKEKITAADLLTVPKGSITEAGLRNNVSVGLQYMAAWLEGNGCVPINNLMEDAATAEISRAQIWQWIHHPGGVLSDGRRITAELFRKFLAEERERLRTALGREAYEARAFDEAARLLDEITVTKEFSTFLTLSAYRRLQ
jgi:malate synthase